MRLSEERCEQSDLLVSECAHCKGATIDDVRDDPRPKLEGYVLAKYEGECRECGQAIEVGDAIGKAEGDPEGPWIHYGCGR